MRIVFITSRFPYPLEKGDKLRAYHQIRQLSKQCRIHLISLNHGEVPDAHRAELLKYCDSVEVFRLRALPSYLHALAALFRGLPLQVGYFYRSPISRLISRQLQQIKPDAIYFQLIRTARYRTPSAAPSFIDFQDCFSAGMARRARRSKPPRRWLFALEALLLKRFEHRCFHEFDGCTIISEYDRELLGFDPEKRIAVVPNGVDTDYFRPQEAEITTDLLFTGNLGYPPNIDASIFLAKEVLPLLEKHGYRLRLTLAGANPAPVVKSLESGDVHVSGWIEDIRDAYASCRIFVAPMRLGTGLQNKLLEAMAMRKPCVTTSLANQGLGAREGIEVLIGDNAEETANQIIRLFGDAGFAGMIADNGYNFVKERFSWERAVPDLRFTNYDVRS